MLKIYAAAESDVGCVRATNEDNVYVNGVFMQPNENEAFSLSVASDYPETGVFAVAVCDGMGGEAFGEKASYLATKGIFQLQSELSEAREHEAWGKAVKNYVRRINSSICDEIKACGKSMGTTIVLLCIGGGYARAYNMGDSRAYVLRKGEMSQLSQDHTVAQRLVRIGAITQEQAKKHPDRNKLTQCLGTPEDEIILEMHEAKPIQIQAGDIFLLCSDGLTEMCNDSEISRILSQCDDIAEAARELVNSAKQNGGHDNISVIAVSVKRDIL